jgi:hypothetical protein
VLQPLTPKIFEITVIGTNINGIDWDSSTKVEIFAGTSEKEAVQIQPNPFSSGDGRTGTYQADPASPLSVLIPILSQL